MSSAFSNEYKVSIQFNRETGNCSTVRWRNHRGEYGAPGDYPSIVRYTDSGSIRQAHWKRDGKAHRANGLPTNLYFSRTTPGKLIGAVWALDGVPHRENGLPSSIMLYEDTMMPAELRFKNLGQRFRPEGKPHYIDFDQDGTAYDSGGKVIEVEDFHTGWLDNVPVEALLDQNHLKLYPFM